MAANTSGASTSARYSPAQTAPRTACRTVAVARQLNVELPLADARLAMLAKALCGRLL